MRKLTHVFPFLILVEKMHLYKAILLFSFFLSSIDANFKHTVVATKCLNTQNIITI